MRGRRPGGAAIAGGALVALATRLRLFAILMTGSATGVTPAIDVTPGHTLLPQAIRIFENWPTGGAGLAMARGLPWRSQVRLFALGVTGSAIRVTLQAP